MSWRFWITNDGTVRLAVDGLAALARRVLDPRGILARPADLAIRLGYIAVTVSESQVVLRYHQYCVSQLALTKLVEWLPTVAAEWQPVIRSTYSGRWFSVTHPTVHSAAVALEGAAVVATGWNPSPPRIRRLSIDQLSPRLGATHAALTLVGNRPEDLINFVHTWPDRDHISLFELSGERATLLVAGGSLGRYERALGRDLTERSDLRYALTVRAEMQQAAREQEAAHYERRVTINGTWTPYRNLKYPSLPDRSGRRILLTTSETA